MPYSRLHLASCITKGLFTSNSLQCALKRIRIECTSNPDSIHFGIFHITKMQCALSNRIITQSALCILYIESNSVSQHGDAPSYFKTMLFFCLSVIWLHYKHKLAREQRKYMAKKRAEKRRKLFLRRKQQFRRHATASTKIHSHVLGVAETFSYTTFIVPRNAIKLILYILFSQNDYKNFRRFVGPASQLYTIMHLSRVRVRVSTRKVRGLRSGAIPYVYRCSIHFNPLECALGPNAEM